MDDKTNQQVNPLPCPVCGGEARRSKHGAVECTRYCTRSSMCPTWAECVKDWNSPTFRPGVGATTRSDLAANTNNERLRPIKNDNQQ